MLALLFANGKGKFVSVNVIKVHRGRRGNQQSEFGYR
jgi:hypothetical protein